MFTLALLIFGVLGIVTVICLTVLVDSGRVTLRSRSDKKLAAAEARVTDAESRAKEAYWNLVEHRMLDMATDPSNTDIQQMHRELFGNKIKAEVMPMGR